MIELYSFYSAKGQTIIYVMKAEPVLLYTACKNIHGNIVELLLSRGANINLCKENWDSPLDVACQNGFESTV